MDFPFNQLRLDDESAVVALQVSRHADFVALARASGNVEVWDINGCLCCQYQCNKMPIQEICISDDGRLIATLGAATIDGEMRTELFVYDSATETARSIPHSNKGGSFRSPMFVPHGHQLLVCDDKPILVNGVSATHIEHDIPENVTWDTIAFSRCGKIMALSNADGLFQVFVGLKPGGKLAYFGKADHVQRIAFSNENDVFAIFQANSFFDVYEGVVYSSSEEPIVCEDLLLLSFVRSLESWLLIDRTSGLRLFDSDATCFGTFRMPDLETISMISSDIDGNVLAVARTDGTVDLWHSCSLLPYLPVGASSLLG